jgi:hypothetical protein
VKPGMTTLPGAVASGKAGAEKGIDKGNGATLGASRIAQTRADSIRLQALGQIGGA